MSFLLPFISTASTAISSSVWDAGASCSGPEDTALESETSAVSSSAAPFGGSPNGLSEVGDEASSSMLNRSTLAVEVELEDAVGCCPAEAEASLLANIEWTRSD